MEVPWASTKIATKNVDQYVWISKQGIVFFEIFISEIRHFFYYVMDIVSQLKDRGIPITIPFCMKKSVLFIYIYNKIHFSLFYCVLHFLCEMLHQWLNIWMIKYFNEEMWNLMTWYKKINPNITFKCTNKNLIDINTFIRYV